MAEAVEDALPVLQVEEHRNAAHSQQHGRCDPRGHLGLGALALTGGGNQALAGKQTSRPRDERGEDD